MCLESAEVEGVSKSLVEASVVIPTIVKLKTVSAVSFFTKPKYACDIKILCLFGLMLATHCTPPSVKCLLDFSDLVRQ